MTLSQPFAVVAASFRSVGRALKNWIDRLYGYDVFVAHRRIDGAQFASGLVDFLDKEGLSVFIDKREYAAGDDLSFSTLRHIRKATMLVVIGSPGILHHRDPDWVLQEIETYLLAHTDETRRILPIDFGGSLSEPNSAAPIVARLSNTIRLEEPVEALFQLPSPKVVAAIVEQFRRRRRDRVRLRVFQAIGLVLAALAVAAGLLAWFANRALIHAQRNLAANYMTAANSRLDSGFRDEAAALAAESLRNFDSQEARRLLVENPPLDLSEVIPFDTEGVFALDVDMTRRRVASVGYQGVIRIQDLDPKKTILTTKLGTEDLMGVRFTLDGSSLIVGGEKGTFQVLSTYDLTSRCGNLPKFSDRVDGLLLDSKGTTLFLRTGGSIYAVAFQEGCPAGPFQTVFQAEYIADYVVDNKNNRLIVAVDKGLVGVNLAEGELGSREIHRLPPRANGDITQPIRLAIQPETNLLCVLALGDQELTFLDRDFAVARPFGVRPFGSIQRSSNNIGVFAFDTDGDRLVITDGDGFAYIWSFPDRRVERLLRVHESRGGGAAVLTKNLLITIGQEAPTENHYPQTLKVISLDPPARSPIPIPHREGVQDAVTRIEKSPADDSILMATQDRRIVSFNLIHNRVQEIARSERPIAWVGRSPRSEAIAFFGGSEVTILAQNQPPRHELFSEQSPTGLYSAAWLSDGTTLAVGGGWTKPILVPIDAARSVSFGPQLVNSTIDNIVSGPRALVVLGGLLAWETQQNKMRSIELADEHLAVMNNRSWGANGIATLTRGGLFLRGWDRLDVPAQVSLKSIVGDDFEISATGNRIAVFRRSDLDIYDLPSGTLRAKLHFPVVDVHCAALNSSGSALVADCAYPGDTHAPPLIVWSLHPLDDRANSVADRVQEQTGRVQSDFQVSLPHAR